MEGHAGLGGVVTVLLDTLLYCLSMGWVQKSFRESINRHMAESVVDFEIKRPLRCSQETNVGPVPPIRPRPFQPGTS